MIGMVAERIAHGMFNAQAILDDIARKIFAEYPNDPAARSTAVMNAIRKDADLLHCLYSAFTPQAMAALFARVDRKHRLDRGGDPKRTKAQPAAQAGIAKGATATALKRRQAQRQQGRVAAATLVRFSMLDRFLINNRPIGDCTPAEARAWAKSRQRDGLYIELLISGVPENEPIRRYIKPDEADRFWTEAHGSAAA